ncbi:MAG TPA: cytochrome c [Caulobacteraceae bacterium]|jgi:cytochrome c oxidase cbb3-type subunit 3|nr:cytochrome c [Caulobacteraceae bacterium]
MSSGFARLIAATLALALVACERESRDYAAPPIRTPAEAEHYEHDAFDVAQGERLYQWMNCVGCHSHGGGGMGPALSDNQWIYGGSLAAIHDSIRDGRPNGMPAWRARMTDQQIWQVAAYVRSMGRYIAKDVAPSRNDGLQSGRAESRRPRRTPVWGPPA